MNRKVLCLDWDSRSLRIVVARVGPGRMALEDAHSHRLPPELDAESAESLGDFIAQMLRRHRLRYKTVLVDIPRERAVINRLTLPPTPENEVAAAVRFQAVKELPFPMDQAAVDFVVTARNENGLATEVLLAAVTLETLERTRATCAAAGLTPTRIGLRPYANLVSLRHTENLEQQRVLLVDVGPGAAEIDVFAADGLAFARSANVNVPVPAEPGSVGDSRVISLAELGDLERPDEALQAAVESLLVEVTRSLQAYRATEGSSGIDKIVVAGGTGVETLLAEGLQRRLGLPVTMFDPTGPLGIDEAEGRRLRSFSAALGLAWGLSREGLLALDFLNPKRPVPASEIWQRKLRVAGLAVAMVLVAVGGVLGKSYWKEVQRLRDLKKDVNARRAALRDKLTIRNRIEEAEEWGVEAVWPENLLAITERAPEPGKKVLIQEITFDAQSRTPGITLRNVYAGDWEVPLAFVKALNEVQAKDGKRPYEASQRVWTELPDGGTFKGKTDIRIDLRELQIYRDKAGEREKVRRNRLKDL